MGMTKKVLAAVTTSAAAAATLVAMSTPAHAAYTTPYISVESPSGSAGITKALIALDPYDRGRVVLGGRTGGSRDQWVVEQVATRNGHGVYRLKNVYAQKCLDKSQDVANANGNAVYLYTCSNADNQRWEKIPNGSSGWTQLKNVAAGRCLDVKGPTFSDAIPIHVWDCYSTWSQRWNILP